MSHLILIYWEIFKNTFFKALPHQLCKPKQIAFNSKTLTCSCVSSDLKLPFLEKTCKTATQPKLDALVITASSLLSYYYLTTILLQSGVILVRIEFIVSILKCAPGKNLFSLFKFTISLKESGVFGTRKMSHKFVFFMYRLLYYSFLQRFLSL